MSGVARGREVPLVDFVALVEGVSPQGIAGEELFLDHVHPTIDGHRLLALAIIDEMARQKWLTPGSGWDETAIGRVASRIMEGADPKAQGMAMCNLSKVFSWAGKMEDAYRAAEKALELYPGDAEAHYQAGALARKLGKTDEAVERLTHLVGVNLTRGVDFYVKAHVELVAVLAERGEYERCEQVLQKLQRLDPDNVEARRQRPEGLWRSTASS